MNRVDIEGEVVGVTPSRLAGWYKDGTEHLHTVSLEALMCLADPDWGWKQRGSMSGWITDRADEVLTEKLDALVTA